MADKQFINGIFIREVTFQSGGSVLNVSIPADKVDAVCAQLKAAADNGWVKLRISENRQPTLNRDGKTIATHSLSVDTWKPTQGGNAPTPPRASSARQSASQETTQSDDVPF